MQGRVSKEAWRSGLYLLAVLSAALTVAGLVFLVESRFGPLLSVMPGG